MTDENKLWHGELSGAMTSNDKCARAIAAILAAHAGTATYAATATEDETGGGGLQEIVVTAQRRSENIQDIIHGTGNPQRHDPHQSVRRLLESRLIRPCRAA